MDIYVLYPQPPFQMKGLYVIKHLFPNCIKLFSASHVGLGQVESVVGVLHVENVVKDLVPPGQAY